MNMRAVVYLSIALHLVACSDDVAETRDVPPPLSDLESTAEDAYDRALVGDVAAVAAAAEHLGSAWGSFRDQAISDGALEADAQVLDEAIAGLKAAAAGDAAAVDLARAANAVSGPMDELYAVYDPTIPAGVLELDYLGREVALDGLDGNPEAAVADIDAIEVGWSALRQRVIDADGGQAAADFDASIVLERDAVQANDAAALVEAANLQLELVDAVEQVFGAQEQEDEAD